MYNADQVLIDRLNNNIQTSANNNDPRPLAYITRNKTAISSQRYWEKQLITSSIGTRSSLAVRRPEGSLLADMIFTAQVVDGDAIIRYAEPKNNIAAMSWSLLTTIENISELSIMFDGFMVIDIEKVEMYTTGELPVVFFVDTSGSLKMRNLNDNSDDVTVSDDAVNVASVRGLYSDAADLNDGIWVFYTNTAGELWEAQILNYEVNELTQITLLPDGVTSWIDCWAGLTFDYRIILQLQGNDGKVYTLPSKSRPSALGRSETFNYKMKVLEKLMLQVGTPPPNLINAYNTVEFPLKVSLQFDGEIFLFNPSVSLIWLKGNDGKNVHPIKVEKTNTREIMLTFGSDLIGLKNPQYLEDNKYKPCGFGSQEKVSAIVSGYFPQLVCVDFSNAGNDFFSYKMSVSTALSGEIKKAFDGKAYMPNENMNYGRMKVLTPLSGTLINVSFMKGYSGSQNFSYSMTVSTALSGTLLKADGTPL